MPEKRTLERARRDIEEGKSPSTQAGEFVKEEIDHIRKGKHGARSAKQAIAIGLSKARRAGIDLPPPKAGSGAKKMRAQAVRDSEKGKKKGAAFSVERSRATSAALKREGRSAASTVSLSRQAKSASRKRTATQRSASAKKASRTRNSNR
jgi:hypothetical protein